MFRLLEDLLPRSAGRGGGRARPADRHRRLGLRAREGPPAGPLAGARRGPVRRSGTSTATCAGCSRPDRSVCSRWPTAISVPSAAPCSAGRCRASEPAPMPPSLEISEERLRRWREDTPGCAGRIHLNNAGAALMPRPVLDADPRPSRSRGGDRRLRGGGRRGRADPRRPTATWPGCSASRRPENIAVVENATVAVSQALSAFDFQPGDVLVTTHNDYTSNQIMYLSLARRCGLRGGAGGRPAGGRASIPTRCGSSRRIRAAGWCR